MKFTILGTLEVLEGDRVCTPSAPKVLQVLALLLLRANRPLPLEVVVEELWGDSPPKSAVTTAQTYICHLRKVLDQEGLTTREHELLVTRPYGYMFRIGPEQLDALVFQRKLTEGRRLLEEDRPDAASTRLAEALDLWTGPILAHVARGPVLGAHAIRLEEQRLRALELRIQAEVLLGRDRELIGELRSLVMQYPLNEWFHGQLIRALGRAGRRNEALEAYRRVRTTLTDELGLEPSDELQALHQEVLGATPTALAHWPPRPRRNEPVHLAAE
ncbi:AfsR/SARP family transcriptional regulator [Nocardiopsis sp. FIRDI 009]|uniref:AfsR/SARP family transcriptional regulator n=1 Tax=Nocardiopsis sp. FIRDI 009 TaxID=714197 RepID=UPI001E359231|nr:AfsR/SARP family transcriptional regulator [Nocardiopsis sp. FIRDI 009]